MLLCLTLSVPALLPQAVQPAPEPGIHPRRLLVKVDPRFAGAPVERVLRGLGAHTLWNLPQIGWRALEVEPELLHATHTLLAHDRAFLDVQYDRARRLAHTPNDPLYAGMWHMPQIKANLAWDTEKGDAGVVVAIMDTGLDVTHPDLAANVWVNTGEIPGNLLDDDGNGYVDDRNGYDFAYLDANPNDVFGHGTACAGIVAAVQDNALGVTGVAPQTRIAGIKAALDSGYFYASANVPALVYCADMGFRVISCSFYSDEVVPAERDAIRYCHENGVLPVVAAGNENSVLPFYPAAYPQCLSVGATIDSLDNHAYFSNWGSWVNVAAPGWALSTTTVGGGYTTGFAGTSGACPHVSGIAALLYAADPSATNDEVRAAIEDSALLLDQAPYGKWTNYGRVDADAALDRILGLVSGSVPARFLFAAPCGGEELPALQATLGPNSAAQRVALEVSGVGLEAPNTVEVLRAASPLPLLSQGRQAVTCGLPRSAGPAATTFTLERNGSAVQSWVWEPGPGLLYAASDGCTEDTSGAQAVGGFLQLYREDGNTFNCSEDSGGEIYAEFAVRKVRVPAIGRATLEFRRDYDGLNAGAIETIELYDWSSFSYPYGSWITLSSAPAPTSFATLTLDVPGDPDAYRDEEGTFYLRLTTTNAGASGLLRADMLRLRVR
jgi:hypothetical protein